MSLKFYEKGYESNYEELLTYYPGFYREVYEMREILKAQGKLADGLENSIEQIYFNNFIDTADAETIGKLEAFLHMEYNKARELEVRRRIVKAHFVGYGIASASELKAIVKSYTNSDVDIRFEPFDEAGNNMLFIDFQRGEEETLYISDVINLLEERIPAHIEWRASVAYKFPVGIGVRRKHYKYDYELSGTKPDISKIVGIINRAAATQAKSSRHTVKHRQAEAEGQTGTYPDISSLGALVSVGSVSETKIGFYTNDYKTASETAQEAGEWPAISAIGSQHFLESAVEVKKESYTSDYTPTGILPDNEKLGMRKEINTGSGVTVTDYGVDYIYCGTKFSQS